MHLTQRDWIKWPSPQVKRSTVGQSHTCRYAAPSLPHCLTLRRLAHFTIWAPFFTSTVSGYIGEEGVGGRKGARMEKMWNDRRTSRCEGNVSKGENNKEGTKTERSESRNRTAEEEVVWDTNRWRERKEGEKERHFVKQGQKWWMVVGKTVKNKMASDTFTVFGILSSVKQHL